MLEDESWREILATIGKADVKTNMFDVLKHAPSRRKKNRCFEGKCMHGSVKAYSTLAGLISPADLGCSETCDNSIKQLI